MAGSDSTDTSTTSSAPANPAFNDAITKLFKGLGSAYDAGAPKPFDHSLYSPAGATTQAGWNAATDVANNPNYGSAVNGALDYNSSLIGSKGFAPGQISNINTVNNVGGAYGALGANGGLTSGQTKNIGTANNVGSSYAQLMKDYGAGNPYFEKDLANSNNAAAAAVNSAINTSGRFGGSPQVQQLASTIGNLDTSARATQRDNAFNYVNQALQGQLGASGQAFNEGQTGVGNEFNALSGQGNAASTAFGMREQGINNAEGAAAALPSLYQDQLLPSQTLGAVGSAQDANAQGILQGKYDLYNRQQNNQLDWLSRLVSTASGGTGSAGTTSTTTQPSTPWWQSVLGLAARAA